MTRASPAPSLHPDWRPVVAALRHSGVAADLDLDSVPERLGAVALEPPRDSTMVTLLKEYFRGDGERARGLERQRSARLFAHHAHRRTTADELVSRLSELTPELGGLTLRTEQDSGLLYLQCEGRAIFLDAEEIIVEVDTVDGQPLRRRHMTVRGLLGAVNRLLALAGLEHRYVPLLAPEGLELYVSVTISGASVLEMVGALDDDWEELQKMLCFSGASSEPAPPLQSVA